jgi:A/G-specific adenine glycosylase
VARPLSARSLPALRRALLQWFRANRRALPWREAPSLYKTVVSEFMLQQTQVKTVLPYFARWLERFPDFHALADAPEEAVVKAWEGLGYYSRARNLHKLARALVAAPVAPRTATEWQELPGIGPYTGAAIASIACGDRAACVDGNVARVLARLTADSTAFASGTALVQHFRPLASAVLDPTAPGDFNEAMMELGAVVCLPRTPDCARCPLRRFCATADPVAAALIPQLARAKTEQRAIVRLWCVRDARLLLHRISTSSRRLADLHELPSAADLGLDDTTAQRGEMLLRRSRSITRYRIEESIHHWPERSAPAGAAPLPALSGKQSSATGVTLFWVPLAELERVTLSGPHRRWVRELLARAP